MDRQDLGSGWFCEVGKEYPVEAWAFAVYHDDAADPDYDAAWWSDNVRYTGFVSKEQAAEALALFLQHEALKHCEAYAGGQDERHKAVELVQVYYRFATRDWSYRLVYEPQGVSGWTGYYCGRYGSAVEAIGAGLEQWGKLRQLGTGGSSLGGHSVHGEAHHA